MEAHPPWYVVIRRNNNWPHVRMVPIVIGPYPDMQTAKKEMRNDKGEVYNQRIWRARKEQYVVVEVYLTDEPPQIKEEVIV